MQHLDLDEEGERGELGCAEEREEESSAVVGAEVGVEEAVLK